MPTSPPSAATTSIFSTATSTITFPLELLALDFQLIQARVDNLICFGENLNEISSTFHVLLGEKCVRCSSVSFTACSSNSVNIILCTLWEIIIHHKLNIINIWIGYLRVLRGQKLCSSSGSKIYSNSWWNEICHFAWISLEFEFTKSVLNPFLYVAEECEI